MLIEALLLAVLTGPSSPDQSLTDKEYVALGMAAPDRTWGPADYESAAGVLEKQAATDPTKLPRYASPSSGRIFTRVTSVDDFPAVAKPMPASQRLPLGLQMLSAARRILLSYSAPAGKGLVFDRELAECFGLLLVVSAETMEAVDEFMAQLPADDPQRSVRLEGLVKMRSGLSQIMAGALQTMSERAIFGAEARRSLARHLESFGPRIVSHMSELQRAELFRRLDELVAHEEDDQIRKSLGGLKARSGSTGPQ